MRDGKNKRAITAFTLFVFILSCCLFSLQAKADPHRDPFISTINPSNKMCRDIFYILHLPINQRLLKEDKHSVDNLEEVFVIPQNYPYINLLHFGKATEMNIRNYAPELYKSLDGRKAIFDYDYFATGTAADLDMDGRKEGIYFITKRNLPDFGKLYMQENGSPLVDTLNKLDAVALMLYYNRTYVITRTTNTLKIFMLSTSKTGGQNVPEGKATAEIMCSFAYMPGVDDN